MLIILFNTVTLAMYDPYDPNCESEKCKTLEKIEARVRVGVRVRARASC